MKLPLLLPHRDLVLDMMNPCKVVVVGDHEDKGRIGQEGSWIDLEGPSRRKACVYARTYTFVCMRLEMG